MEKEKTSILKNLWFWICIILIVCIISITILKNSKDTSNNSNKISKVEAKVQNIYSDCVLYSSADENTLILEVQNNNDMTEEQRSSILQTIKNNFDNYSKFIIIAHIESKSDTEKSLKTILVQEYDFKTNELISNKSYVDFEKYQELFNLYKNSF